MNDLTFWNFAYLKPESCNIESSIAIDETLLRHERAVADLAPHSWICFASLKVGFIHVVSHNSKDAVTEIEKKDTSMTDLRVGSRAEPEERCSVIAGEVPDFTTIRSHQ